MMTQKLGRVRLLTMMMEMIMMTGLPVTPGSIPNPWEDFKGPLKANVLSIKSEPDGGATAAVDTVDDKSMVVVVVALAVVERSTVSDRVSDIFLSNKRIHSSLIESQNHSLSDWCHFDHQGCWVKIDLLNIAMHTARVPKVYYRLRSRA